MTSCAPPLSYVSVVRVSDVTYTSSPVSSQVRQTRNVDIGVNVDIQSHPAEQSTDKNYMSPFMKQPTENNFCSICWFLHKNMLKDTFVLLFLNFKFHICVSILWSVCPHRVNFYVYVYVYVNVSCLPNLASAIQTSLSVVGMVTGPAS